MASDGAPQLREVGDEREAAALLREHLGTTSNPEAATARMQAMTHEKQGEIPQAVGAYGRALQLDPKYVEAWVGRGGLLSQQGRLDKAVLDFTRAIKLQPKCESALYLRGCALQHKGDLKAAAKDFDAVVGLAPEFLPGLLSRADVRTELGQLDGALADLGEVLRLDEKHVPALQKRGGVYGRMGRPKEAIADFSRCLELDPKFFPAYLNRGRVLDAVGRTDEAVEDYTRSLEHHETTAALVFRGVARARRKKYGEAVADFTRAAEIDPEDARILLSRGRALYESGDIEGGIRDIRRALELAPQLEEPRGWLSTMEAALAHKKAQLEKAKEAAAKKE